MVDPSQLSRAKIFFSQVGFQIWVNDNANNDDENPLKMLFLAVHVPLGIHQEFSCWYGAMIIDDNVKDIIFLSAIMKTQYSQMRYYILY